MKFQLLHGIHAEAGTVYQAGKNDIIETERDLCEIFHCKGKFKKLDEESGPAFVIFKNEVTNEFPGCKELGHQVFHENNLYYIVNSEGKPIHETKISHKDTVREILDGLK